MSKKKDKLMRLYEKADKLKLSLDKTKQELTQVQSQITQAKNEMVEEKFESLGVSFFEALDLLDELGTGSSQLPDVDNVQEDSVHETI